MNNKKDFHFLGKIIKTHKYGGELIFLFEAGNIDNFQNLEVVYIEINNELIPFFVEKLTIKNINTAIIKLEDIDTFKKAQTILHADFYIPSYLLPTATDNKFNYLEIIGFNVTDKKHGHIGTIKGVIDLPHQSLLQVEFNNKEILIPIVDEIIVSVNHQEKQIQIDAPEGLIEIYI